MIPTPLSNMKEALATYPRTNSKIISPADELILHTESFILSHQHSISLLKSEINLYKQQISDLKSINDDKFHKIVEKIESSQTSQSSVTYSSVAQNSSVRNPIPNYKTILVKPKNSLLSPPQVKEAICNSISTYDLNAIKSLSINLTWLSNSPTNQVKTNS
ncbi:hypothetical protein DERF_009166 [Dermatophagoides farinae]|uniref:Uncharacterized protein n=1 Tax=Dermatophagoides farinae TaxID=6954 RepID=A0A922L0I8_DERFA|nr:hypothetical protein DERF_009166 [Dermatophagoides farinae]